MPRPGEWLRGLRSPRLAVFATQVRSGNTLATKVAIRLTTTAERVARAGLTVSGVAVAGLGLYAWPNSAVTGITLGVMAVFTAIRTQRTTTTLVDAPLARAAVRAALTEGAKHAEKHWRIEGPAAVEVGRELVRLQKLWLPGHAAGAGGLDQARATRIADAANARRAPHLGELSLAEHQAWLGTPELAELTDEKPDHRAEYHRDGAAWPSLGERAAGPTWPTLDRDLP